MMQILDSVTEAIIAMHVDGRILLFNATAEHTFRCPVAEAIGEPIDRFIPAGFITGPALELAAFRSVLARRADGEAFRAEAAVTHFEVAGDELCTILVRDMTRHVWSENAVRRINDSLEAQARRIAQSLHDEAGQLLAAAHIALAEAAHGLPAANAERLTEARDHLDRIEEQLRRLAHELHPRILDDLGLVGALEFLALGVEKRQGIAVSVEAALPVRMRRAVEVAIYRLVQEALSNARKHARAARVRVRLEHAAGAVRCSISDDGIGFEAAIATARLQSGACGMGLSGIRDRVEGLGGTIHIESAPGRGTELTITIPVES